ncbi:CsiV family protein [Polycyclovorans algicola]|uniref:CsiV family protein n=1 Tax=Polycyclovorans algicola TaxID=616992 RepID=UPI0009FCBA30|nr:CsiV family protein [Polycyclovorans algicola]
MPYFSLTSLLRTLAGVLLALGLVGGSALAQGPQYRVDVIVFLDRHASTEGGQPLPGRNLPPGLQLDDGLGLVQARISLLPEDDFALSQQWRRLDNAQRYEPLVRLSWLQDNPPEKNGPRLRIEDGAVVTYGEDGSTPILALSGSIALEMGRFLHIDADLRYVSSESGAPRIYPMRERRRVRRGELHYLDSPRLGLLARVVRTDD